MHKLSKEEVDFYRLEILHKRNDTLLNNYNDVITHLWRSNTDIQFIVDKQALKFYLTKYINKGEPLSKFMEDMGMFAD